MMMVLVKLQILYVLMIVIIKFVLKCIIVNILMEMILVLVSQIYTKYVGKQKNLSNGVNLLLL